MWHVIARTTQAEFVAPTPTLTLKLLREIKADCAQHKNNPDKKI